MRLSFIFLSFSQPPLPSSHLSFSLPVPPLRSLPPRTTEGAGGTGRGHKFTEQLQARSSSEAHFSSFYLKSAVCLYNYTRFLSEHISRNPCARSPLLSYFAQLMVLRWWISRLICDRRSGGCRGIRKEKKNCLYCIKHEMPSLCKIVIHYGKDIHPLCKICLKYCMANKIQHSEPSVFIFKRENNYLCEMFLLLIEDWKNKRKGIEKNETACIRSPLRSWWLCSRPLSLFH